MKIMVELKIGDRYAGRLMDHVTAAVREFEDSIRCPSVSKTGDLRCELYADHSPNERHKQGNESWPNVADGIEVGVKVIELGTHQQYEVTRVGDRNVFLTWPSGAGAGAEDRATFWRHFRRVE